MENNKEKQGLHRAIQKGVYTRTKSKDRKKINDYLCKSYSTKTKEMSVGLFCSGNNAIYSLIQTIVDQLDPKDPSVFVIGDELYCDTLRTFEHFAEQKPFITIVQVNVTKTNEILKVFEEHKSKI